MGCMRTYEGHRRFTDNWTSIEDYPCLDGLQHQWARSRCHLFKSTVNNMGGCRWMHNIRRDVSYHLNATIQHSLCHSKIHSTAAEKQTAGALCCHLTRTSSSRWRKLFKKHLTGDETWVGGYNNEMTVLTMDNKIFPETQKYYKFTWIFSRSFWSFSLVTRYGASWICS